MGYLSNGYVWKMQNKGLKPGSDILAKIAEYLGTTEKFLRDGEDSSSSLVLSHEEKQLVIAYRQLTPDQKDMVRAMLKVDRNPDKREKSRTSENTA